MSKKILAIWAHPYTDFTPENLDAQVDALFERYVRAGISVYLPFLTEDGDAYYRSDILRTKHDYLETILKYSNKYKIKVYPLFGFGKLGAICEGRTYQAYVPEGLDEQYPVGRSVCASWKNNQEDVVCLIREVLDRYPLEGIQLDYFRYPNMSFEADYPCECQACCERRKPWLGHDKLTEADRRNPSVMYKEIAQKNQNILRALKRVSSMVKGQGKTLTLAARARYLEDAVYEGQDWRRFAHEGYFDMIFPMSYNTCKDRFQRFLTDHHRLLEGSDTLWIAGVGKQSSLSDLTTDAFIEQIQMAIAEGAEGVCIFSHKGMTESDFVSLEKIRDIS